MRDLPTGTITLLFTDIEGSTHLLQQLGARYAELLTECRDLLRAASIRITATRSIRRGMQFLPPLLAPVMPSQRR